MASDRPASRSSRKNEPLTQRYFLAAGVLVILLLCVIDHTAKKNAADLEQMPVSVLPGINPVQDVDATPAPQKESFQIPMALPGSAPEAAQPVSPPTPVVSVVAPDAEAWSYFRPFWQSEAPKVLDPEHPMPERRLVEQGVDLKLFLNDPHNRIEKDFHVPPEMRQRVLFWMMVHSRFTSQMRLLHDRKNPNIIYGYADYSSVYAASENKIKAFQRVYQIERKVLKELRARLSEAGGLTNTKIVSPWEKSEIRGLLSRAGALSPADVNSLVNSIRSQTGQRDEFLLALSRSQELLPFIESVFRRQDLPVALGRIPFVESSFNARAQSKVGAMGIWQFMPQTARQMISADPNLWADPLRQTRSAAKLFKIMRSMLPDWSTSVTSYNSGAGRLKHLCQKYHTKSIVPLLEVSDGASLGFAGKNFYAQFLSVNIVEAYRKEIFPQLKTDEDTLLAFHPIHSFTREFRETY